MIKEISKTGGAAAVQVGGWGLVGAYLESIVSVKWPVLAPSPGMFTMAFTTVFHSGQKIFWAWMAAKGVKPPSPDETSAGNSEP